MISINDKYITDKGNLTDSGNYIVDLQIGKKINNTEEIYYKIIKITGVHEAGLFINTCNNNIVGRDNEAIVIENPGSGGRKAQEWPEGLRKPVTCQNIYYLFVKHRFCE
jgi:hypothetical protein